MSPKVSCNLMVNDSDETSFLFALESKGQLDRDVTVQNRIGDSFVAFALSTEEALDMAKQIQAQYMDYTKSVVERQRDESKKLKEQMSRLSVKNDAGDGVVDDGGVSLGDKHVDDSERTEDES